MLAKVFNGSAGSLPPVSPVGASGAHDKSDNPGPRPAPPTAGRGAAAEQPPRPEPPAAGRGRAAASDKTVAEKTVEEMEIGELKRTALQEGMTFIELKSKSAMELRRFIHTARGTAPTAGATKAQKERAAAGEFATSSPPPRPPFFLRSPPLPPRPSSLAPPPSFLSRSSEDRRGARVSL